MKELLPAIIIFLLSAICLLLSVRHFMQKGTLLNNAFLYASKRERETMDKAPHYRQSAIVFLLLAVVFLIIGLSLVLRSDKVLWLEIPAAIAVLCYAVISSVTISRKAKKQ